MVCVWPPHTSMNLNESPAASSVMCRTTARAATGSRYSSTKRMSDPRAGDGARRVESGQLVGVGAAHHAQRIEGHRRLGLVDLGHGEPDVDEHPVAGDEVVVLQ